MQSTCCSLFQNGIFTFWFSAGSQLLSTTWLATVFWSIVWNLSPFACAVQSSSFNSTSTLFKPYKDLDLKPVMKVFLNHPGNDAHDYEEREVLLPFETMSAFAKVPLPRSAFNCVAFVSACLKRGQLNHILQFQRWSDCRCGKKCRHKGEAPEQLDHYSSALCPLVIGRAWGCAPCLNTASHLLVALSKAIYP